MASTLNNRSQLMTEVKNEMKKVLAAAMAAATTGSNTGGGNNAGGRSRTRGEVNHAPTATKREHISHRTVSCYRQTRPRNQKTSLMGGI